MLQIFLESKPVAGVTGVAGHLYLVLRDTGENGQNVYDAATDYIIRGGPPFEASVGALVVVEEALFTSADSYDEGETPASRNSLNITNLITGKLGVSVELAWAKLASAASALNNEYAYDWPVLIRDGIANSNAVVLTLLNSCGIDARDIQESDGSLYLTNYFFDFPGASDSKFPTLLGFNTAVNDLDARVIQASSALTSGVSILGRDTIDDVLLGTKYSDNFYGGQRPDANDGVDTVSYENAASAVVISARLDITGRWFESGAGGEADGDSYTSIENFIGSSYNDTFEVVGTKSRIISGGAGSDTYYAGSGADDIFDGSGAYAAKIYQGAVGEITNASDEIDTVSYSNAIYAAQFGKGVEVNLGMSDGLALPAGTIIVADDGSGHTDTLISIEKIVGSIYSDTVKFAGNEANVQLAGPVTIDGGASIDGVGDVADYSEMADGVTFHLQDGKSPIEGVTLINFESIVGTQYNDRLKFEGSASSINALGRSSVDLGGGSFDVVDFSEATGPIQFYFGAGKVGGVTLSGFETVVGSQFDDLLVGDQGANFIEGGGAATWARDDLSSGDHLLGGGGSDVFIVDGGEVLLSEAHTVREDGRIVFRADILTGATTLDLSASTGIPLVGGTAVELAYNEFGVYVFNGTYEGETYKVTYEPSNVLWAEEAVTVIVTVEYGSSNSGFQFAIQDFINGDFGISLLLPGEGTIPTPTPVELPIDPAFASDGSGGAHGAASGGSGGGSGAGGSGTSGGAAGAGGSSGAIPLDSSPIAGEGRDSGTKPLPSSDSVPRDPLVIDLNGDGIALTSAHGGTALFDIDNDGFREAVGWFGTSDGLLVLDNNANGIIDDAKELFGTDETDGFSALSDYDTNNDGIIDSDDSAFSDLKVWADADGDGVTDPGELHTLSDFDIAAINLGATAVGKILNGNVVHSTSTVVLNTGETRDISAVFLDVDQQTSRVIPPAGFQLSAAAAALPELAGNGDVADLSYAMTNDGDLLALVKALVLSSPNLSESAFRNGVENVLLAWTGADQVDASSRGQYVNAKHLAVIEAFWGQPYTAFGEPVDQLHHMAGDFVEASYDALVDGIAARVFVQTFSSWMVIAENLTGADLRAHPGVIFSNITYDAVTDQLSGSVGDSIVSLVSLSNLETAPDLDVLTILKAEHDNGYFDLIEKGLYLSDHAAFMADIRAGFKAALPEASDGLVETFADIIEGASIFGTTGADTIVGTNANEVIFGSSGDDVLGGADGNDTYLYNLGDGHDTISESYLNGSTDKLVLTDGILPSEVTLSRAAGGDGLTLTFVDGGSITLGNEFFEVGAPGIEQILFADGTVWNRAMLKLMLIAQSETSGNDAIYGFGGTGDTLQGGAGDDALYGLSGNDTYIYNLGDGHDTITDSYLNGSEDVLVLGAGILSSEVGVSRSGGSDTIALTFSDGGSITLQSEVYEVGTPGIEQIIFADGTIWGRSTLKEMLVAQSETPGDDAIYGFGGDNDSLQGGAGDDVLNGLSGNDTYIYNLGDGHDTIAESYLNGSSDKLVLGEGILASEVTVTRSSSNLNDVTLTFLDGGSVMLSGEFYQVGAPGVEQIIFADGTIWTRSTLQDALINVSGTSGNDTITGFGALNDTLNGGQGDDTLNGLDGDDTYIYNLGDGHDVITENYLNGSTDRIVLGAGILPSEVTLTRSAGSNEVALTFVDGGSITIGNEFYEVGAPGVEQIIFADGTVWDKATLKAALIGQSETIGNDAIYGFGGDNDTLQGGAGDDLLSGLSGNDTYLYNLGDGHDTIVDSYLDGAGDVLILGEAILASEVTLSRTGTNDDITITFVDGGSIVLQGQYKDVGTAGVDQIVFADGTVWDRTSINQNAPIRGTSGNDTLSGGAEDDTLDGGGGNDTLNGGTGSDTYIFKTGYGNDIVVDTGWSTDTDLLKLEGLSVNEVTLSRSLSDIENLVVTIIETGEQITVSDQFNTMVTYGIEQIEFAGGLVWDRAAIAENTWFLGTSGSDTISGAGTDDKFDGGAGNDTLSGGNGSDTYIFTAGYGNDFVNDTGAGGDTDAVILVGLAPADVTVWKSGNNLVVEVHATGEQMTVANQFNSMVTYGIEQLKFADGTIWDRTMIESNAWLFSTGGADTINGTSGNDKIDGGAGNDTLNGGGGSDTYAYAMGYGNDIINDTGSGSDTDVVKLLGLNPADVTISRPGSAPDNLSIKVNATGEQITVSSQFSSSVAYGVEQIQFADGTIWDRSQIRANAWIRGTSGNDTITNSAGSDGFIFASGDGNDTINNSGASANDVDTLKLVGLTPADVTIARSTANVAYVVITITATGEKVTLTNQFNSSYYNIEQIVFGDGTIWDTATLQQKVGVIGTSGNDTLSGYANQNDVMQGGAGNDTMNGLSGNDTYIYNLGDGHDTITEDNYNGSDKVVLGSGILVSDVVVTRSTSDIYDVTLGFTDGGSILLNDEFYVSTDRGVEQIVFGDGAVWTKETLRSMLIAQSQTAGNDTIFGFLGDDTLQGGAGNDTMNGLSGNDTYIYNLGDGHDTITEASYDGTDSVVLGAGIVAAGVAVSRATPTSADVTLSFSDGGAITLLNEFNGKSQIGVEQVVFSDGTTWALSDIKSQFLAHAATLGNDTIYGFDGINDTVTGDAGNDTLYGLSGNDIISGGAGNDTLSGGDGNDALYGGVGADNLSGGAGTDTFYFAAGDGADTIQDFTAGAASVDLLDLTGVSGVHTLADILALAHEVSGSTIIDWGNGDSITLSGIAMSTLHADDFRFAA